MLVNLLAFKIGWLSSVIGVAQGMPLLGPSVIFVAIALHIAMAKRPLSEFLLVCATGVLGAVADSVMISAGWLSYPSGMLVSGMSPYWIIAMWMLFATTFNVSFRWLHSRLPVAALFGAISGPLSYYFGAKFSAVTLVEFYPAMLALAVSWGAMMPVLLTLAKRLDGEAAAPVASKA